MAGFGTDKGLELFTATTPNGYKASVALELLGVPYHVTAVDISKNEQKSEFYLTRVNPNGRIPALVDHDAGDLNIFESGAIFLYLAKYYDPQHKLLPQDKRQEAHALSWLNWQMGGLGPMQGQANHFTRYAPEKVEYGINRYTNETRRLLTVLDTSLKGAAAEGRGFLVGDSVSVADVASYPWVVSAPWAIDGFSFEEYPHLKAWVDRLAAMPEVERGMSVPTKSKLQEALKDPALMKQMIEGAQKMMVSTSKQ